MTITLELRLTPSIVVRMSAEEDLVGRIRRHENVDSLEPIIPGSFGAEIEFSQGGDRPLILAAVVRTSDGQKGLLSVHRGDKVTAEYHQPNGLALTAKATIR